MSKEEKANELIQKFGKDGAITCCDEMLALGSLVGSDLSDRFYSYWQSIKDIILKYNKFDTMKTDTEYVSREQAKIFFDAGYDYRSSLLPEIIEEFGEHSQPDFEEVYNEQQHVSAVSDDEIFKIEKNKLLNINSSDENYKNRIEFYRDQRERLRKHRLPNEKLLDILYERIQELEAQIDQHHTSVSAVSEDMNEFLYKFIGFYHEYFKAGNPDKHLPVNSDLECISDFLETYPIPGTSRELNLQQYPTGALVKRFGEVVVEREKYKELYEQECTNHNYTRIAWDRTTEERDKLKHQQAEQSEKGSEEVLRVGEDMICPVTKEHCDDECCTVGAECNLSGSEGIEPPEDWESQAKALSAIKKGLEISFSEAMEECERLAKNADFWQQKCYDVITIFHHRKLIP